MKQLNSKTVLLLAAALVSAIAIACTPQSANVGAELPPTLVATFVALGPGLSESTPTTVPVSIPTLARTARPTATSLPQIDPSPTASGSTPTPVVLPTAKTVRLPTATSTATLVPTPAPTVTPVPTPTPTPAPRPPVGTNLGVLRYWIGYTPFVDVFKSASTWIPSAGPFGAVWDTGLAVPLRDDGFPIQIPFTAGNSAPQTVKALILRDSGWAYPTGTYTLMFEGDGEVIVEFDAIGGPYIGGGTYTFQVPTADEGILLAITRSEASDPVRNIRVILPGYADVYQSQPYHPDFLDKLDDFSVTRFSEWLPVNTALADPNDLAPTTWASRTLPTALQSTENGVAWEHVIAISNAANTAPWITIPHKADDDYVLQVATLFRDTLNPGLRVHLEYSNEVWNSDEPFKLQRDWANRQGLKLGLSNSDPEAGYRYTAKRSAEIFKIFEDVFGAGSGRVVNILAGFQADTGVAQEIMTAFEQANVNGVPVNPWGIKADAFAIATYFGGDVADSLHFSGQSGSASITKVLDELAADIAEDVSSNLIAHRNLLNQWNLPIVAYEGGQSLWALTEVSRADSVLIQKLHAANRDPRIAAIYKDFFDAWFGNGGNLLMHYSLVTLYDQWAAFGSLESQDQDLAIAPKHKALLDLIAEFENGTRPQPPQQP